MSTTVKAPKMRGKMPPGPRGGLLLGNTFAYMKDPLGFLGQSVRTYGDVVKLRLGHLRTYLLVHPQHIEYVLRTHHENFVDAMELPLPRHETTRPRGIASTGP
jgi:hypothetical protein